MSTIPHAPILLSFFPSILIISKINIKRHRWNNAEQRILFSLCTGTISTILEVNEVWIIPIIYIIDAKHPLFGVFCIVLFPYSTYVQMVVVRSPVPIPFCIVIRPVVNDLVLSTWSRESLPTIEHPCSIECPTLIQSICSHDVNIMPAVVIGVIPLAAIDAVDTCPRPRSRIAKPPSQTAAVLAQTEFHSVTLPFACQRQSFNLNLTAKRLTITIIQHILDFPVICLET